MFKLVKNAMLQAYGYAVFRKRVGVYGWFTVANSKNVKIGLNCAINHGVFILGRDEIVIGNNVILSTKSMLIDSGLDVDSYLKESPQYIKSFIHIEDNAWICAGAIILAGVTIGKNSIVGAGAVVSKSVPAYSVVAGNPARVIRRLNPDGQVVSAKVA